MLKNVKNHDQAEAISNYADSMQGMYSHMNQ